MRLKILFSNWLFLDNYLSSEEVVWQRVPLCRLKWTVYSHTLTTATDVFLEREKTRPWFTYFWIKRFMSSRRLRNELRQNKYKTTQRQWKKKQANWFFPLKRKFTKPNSFGSLWLPLCFERSTARCFEFTDLYVSKMQISDRKFVRYKQLGPQSGELNCFWPFNEG